MSKLYNQLGSRAIVGLMSTSVTDDERQLLKDLKPAGVILFKHNFSQSNYWKQELRELISEVKALTSRAQTLICIDHEGGRVHRLPPPISHFPAACHWRTLAPEIGAAMGSELSSLGFNLNFAPCIDVLTEEQNEVIGDRAFSTLAEEVSSFSAEFLREMETNGVTGCVKHFPGHGATRSDSHFELPVCSLDLAALEACDLVPFRHLINLGASVIMTAHVLFPKLDNSFPATMSRPILTELLRKNLGFQGVVVSDALEMKALAEFGIVDVLRNSFQAGVDFQMFATPTGNQPPLIKYHQAIEKCLARPDLESALTQALETSSDRVAQFMAKVQERFDKAPKELLPENNQELLARALKQASKEA